MKKPNNDYKEIRRRISKCLYRRQHESAYVVGIAILLAVILISLAALLNLK